MGDMLKTISGTFSPRKKRSSEEEQLVEDCIACDMRVQSSMSGRSIERGVSRGDRVSTLAGSSTSHHARPNSLDPGIFDRQDMRVKDDMRVQSSTSGRSTPRGGAKGDRVSALAGASTSQHARSNSLDLGVSDRPPGMVRSGSFDPATMAFPSVTLSFLDTSSPPPHASSWLTDTTTNTPPRSLRSQAAIEKCIAAIEECTAALALQSSTEDGSDAQRHAHDFLRQCHSPLAGGGALGWGGGRRKVASAEDMLAWLDDTTCASAPPEYRTLPTPRSTSSFVAFAKSV